ncbi:MAG: thioredoxin domain-containing protein [Planctomycetota bacterium]
MNRLGKESSPYLLQHARNPVDWYPWGEDAFARARAEGKPIFLSIGYSTCHWCHVMERESFENEATAKLMNEHFVCIKVDREERPDVDNVYMAAVQAMSGSGGWPLSVFLTPEGKPFWGGTYFPPADAFGRPGFPTVLRSLAEAWRTKRNDIEEQSEQLTGHVRALAGEGADADVGEATLAAAYGDLVRTFDESDGGFGSAPKFPRPHTLMFLLRSHLRGDAPRALPMVESTLLHMWRGGIHDHVGGGFHRYSTDAGWLVPHFEKMLYDQALIARAALETFALTGREEFAAIARDVLAYVLRDMTDEGGGFYSAEDADSEGEEGKFHVWAAEELKAVLGEKDAGMFADVYGVKADGNWVDEASRERPGTNILHRPVAPEMAAKRWGMTVAELETALEPMRAKLFDVREKRIHPLKDDKILTDWNGLMIATFAYAGRVLDAPEYTRAAERSADFLLTTMRRDGRLLHRYREGEAAIAAFLDDTAFLAWGLFELHQTTQEARWLEASRDLLVEMIDLFGDDETGGFSFSGKDGERLVAGTKEIYDGAVPSGNSVAAFALLAVGRLVQDERLVRAGEGTIGHFSGHLAKMPTGFPFLMLALDAAVGPTSEVVVTGSADDETLRGMVAEVRTRFLPRAVLAVNPTGEGEEAIRKLIPFLADQPAVDGRATAYVCENYACRAPVTTVEGLRKLLEQLPTGVPASGGPSPTSGGGSASPPGRSPLPPAS